MSSASSKASSSSRLTVLLLGADYYGTLAAVRCLGERGARVHVADETTKARALYSKYVFEKHVHPPLSEPGRLVDWLVDFGKSHPDTVLYPTNDHLAWLLAAHEDRIREVFLTMHPSEKTTLDLLDKGRLSKVCEKLGIDVPATLYADSDAELLELAKKHATFPLLIKPRTQIYLESGIKGSLVERAEDLPSTLERYHAMVRFNPALTSRHPDIARPMLQAYHTAAETNIFSVSGYVDDEHLVSRSAMKVLQRPRKVGIGLCFEGREPEPAVTEQLRALFREVGYRGAFEAEFIADGDRRMLIDVNPRFYSQMGFDVARSLPLPYVIALVAAGRREEAHDVLEEAARWKPAGKHVYCHELMLDLVLTLQGLSGQMSRADVRHWRTWLRENASRKTDAIRDPKDRMPALVDAASWVKHFAKHPRSFVRSYVLNR